MDDVIIYLNEAIIALKRSKLASIFSTISKAKT